MVDFNSIIKNKNGKFNKFLIILFIFPFIVFFGFKTKNPTGASFQGPIRNDSNVKFIYDLTYEKNTNNIMRQEIFKEQLALIEAAENFIILDLFLFNDDYDRNTNADYPNLSEQLTDKLIEKKKDNPAINILFITDEINNFYGVYQSKYIEELKENNIDLVITDLEKIRDSNPVYAGLWRTTFKWFDTEGKGWLPNPFSPDSPKVTVRGYLKLLNFKANHRKVIVSEKNAIVTSMNPHDASGHHSNIAFKVEGSILKDIIQAELDVAKFSGYDNLAPFETLNIEKASTNDSIKTQLITEGKIRDAILEEIKKTKKSNQVYLGMFYLAHREIVTELIKASDRGVDVRLVLDPNKDAFGMKKNGIPNRQVAHEIIKKTNKNNLVRWYDTDGEQFHTKLLLINKTDKSLIIGGSANFTRRNLDDFNLENNLFIEAPKDSPLVKDINHYFNRIWTNEDGIYTVDYEEYKSESFLKTIIYRFQEWSGLSSF